MFPFKVIINFGCCLQFQTNPPCHGPCRKEQGKLISAQAGRVSLVATGSRRSHGSAQLNDCALVAFSNPFEINLIFIYLQSPSLQVLAQEDELHTSKPLSHAKPPRHPPPRPGEMTRGTLGPPPQMVSPALEFPDGLSQVSL